MNNSFPEITQLRNNIDFASVSQFFHTFQSAFKPWPLTTHDIIYAHQVDPNEYVFETEDLERMILDPSERIRLEDLLVRMLRLLTKHRFINSNTWQPNFSKEFDKREFDELNPFIDLEAKENQVEKTEEEGGTQVEKTKKEWLIDFFTLPLDTRIHLLYLLCEWQLDEPDNLREHLQSEEDAVQWRVDPVGFDKKGSTFWLFDDNRLYKETPKPKATKKLNSRKKKRAAAPPLTRRSSRKNTRSSKQTAVESEEEEESEEEGEWMPWKLICQTRPEWEQLPSKYVNSKNTDEQRFHQLLVNDLLPKIFPVLEEREKEIKLQEALMNRKRSSRIMTREREALVHASSYEPESNSLSSTTATHKGGRESNRLAKKIHEKEQQEKESIAKAREDRLLERERRIAEREYRAMAREMQQESQEPESVIDVESYNDQQDAATNPIQLKLNISNTDTPTVVKKPRKPYTKRPKFDEHGNPIPKKIKLDKDGNPVPKKIKLDADGNPIPLKKRGRKPKNKDDNEENWTFDCACGVSGKNLDDGTPMVACEKCGIWQHISCLQKSGQVEKSLKNLDDDMFICRKCHQQQQHMNAMAQDHQQPLKKQKLENTSFNSQMPFIQSSWQQQQQQQQPSHIRQADPISQQHSTPLYNRLNYNSNMPTYRSTAEPMTHPIIPPNSIAVQQPIMTNNTTMQSVSSQAQPSQNAAYVPKPAGSVEPTPRPTALSSIIHHHQPSSATTVTTNTLQTNPPFTRPPIVQQPFSAASNTENKSFAANQNPNVSSITHNTFPQTMPALPQPLNAHPSFAATVSNSDFTAQQKESAVPSIPAAVQEDRPVSRPISIQSLVSDTSYNNSNNSGSIQEQP